MPVPGDSQVYAQFTAVLNPEPPAVQPIEVQGIMQFTPGVKAGRERAPAFFYGWTFVGSSTAEVKITLTAPDILRHQQDYVLTIESPVVNGSFTPGAAQPNPYTYVVTASFAVIVMNAPYSVSC